MKTREALLLALALPPVLPAQEEPGGREAILNIHSATIQVERFAPDGRTLAREERTTVPREGDLIVASPQGRGDVVLPDEGVVVIKDNTRLHLRRLDPDGYRLALLDGHRTDIVLGETPTVIELPPFHAIEGSLATLAIHHDLAYREIHIRVIEGEPVKLHARGSPLEMLRAGNRATIPWFRTLDRHRGRAAQVEGAHGCGGAYFRVRRGSTLPEDRERRYDRWKDVVVPEGVTFRREKGRLVLEACPEHLQFPAVVTVGRSAWLVRPGARVEVSLD